MIFGFPEYPDPSNWLFSGPSPWWSLGLIIDPSRRAWSSSSSELLQWTGLPLENDAWKTRRCFCGSCIFFQATCCFLIFGDMFFDLSGGISKNNICQVWVFHLKASCQSQINLNFDFWRIEAWIHLLETPKTGHDSLHFGRSTCQFPRFRSGISHL